MMSLAAGAVGYSKVLFALAILGGAAMCFFGWRFYKLALGLVGFVLGAAIAGYLAWKFSALPADLASVRTYLDVADKIVSAPNRGVLFFCSLSGGAAGALICVLMDKVGAFVIGASLGALLTSAVMVRATPNTYLIALAILSLACGILTLLLREGLVILSTAFNGALALVFGMYGMITQYAVGDAVKAIRRFDHDAWAAIGCVLVLGAIGAYVQFLAAPKAKPGQGATKDAQKPKK